MNPEPPAALPNKIPIVGMTLDQLLTVGRAIGTATGALEALAFGEDEKRVAAIGRVLDELRDAAEVIQATVKRDGTEIHQD